MMLNDEPTAPRLLRAREVAARLGLCTETIYRYNRLGRLPGVRVGGTHTLRFLPESVATLIEAKMPKGQPA